MRITRRFTTSFLIATTTAACMSVGAGFAGADPWDGRSVASGTSGNGRVTITFVNDTDERIGCQAWLWPSSKRPDMDKYLADWKATGINYGPIETLGDPTGSAQTWAEAGQTASTTAVKPSDYSPLPTGNYVGLGSCSGESTFNDFDVTDSATGPGGGGDGSGDNNAWGSLGSLIPG